MDRLEITDGAGDELALSDLSDGTIEDRGLIIECTEVLYGERIKAVIAPTDSQWEQIRKYIDDYLMDKELRGL